MLDSSKCCGEEQSKEGDWVLGHEGRELRFETVWSGKVSLRVTSKVGVWVATQVPGGGGATTYLPVLGGQSDWSRELEHVLLKLKFRREPASFSFPVSE